MLKKAMAEVILSDKEIIENLTRELAEQKEKNDVQKDFYENILKEQQTQIQELIASIKEIERERDKYKTKTKNFVKKLNELDINEEDKFIDFVEKYKNVNEHKCCNCININNTSKNNSQGEINKLDKSSIDDKIKKPVDATLLKPKEKISEQILPPTPTNSNEMKKESIEKISFLENLNLVVYYRNIKNNYSYFKKDDKRYLRCCEIDYKDKEISHTNSITCIKCYRTYNLSEKCDKNSLYKIFSNILLEHIIENEEEILKKIKCNLCNNIYKKEINLCLGCKYVEGCKPIVTQLPDEKVGRRTAECFASETFTQIHFYENVYKTAKEERVNVYEMKPLVEFIKKNNLMKEKQPNIIIKKILRCRYILDIYNEEKYISIQDKIKRIYINLDYIPRLDDSQFDIFKNILVDILDNELENKSQDIKDLNVENYEAIFPCKNKSCKDFLNIEDIFCDSCKKDLKSCTKCGEEFYTDEDNKYCEDCNNDDSYDEDSYE
jgi:hypothetical protein